MKALIYNSGYGKRMGEFTKAHHKCMYPLSNGETIFGRQLRLLRDCGIRDIVVTTGPFAEQLHAVAAAPEFAGLRLRFVPNAQYDTTNYIYSLYLAREHVRGDVLVLHGDLVFDRLLLEQLLADPRPSVATAGLRAPLPEKDFKVRLEGGELREVSVKIFDADCRAFQPLYKLSAQDWAAWVARVETMVEAGETTVYAENALNQIARDLHIGILPYDDLYIDEIDTLEDGARVSAAIRGLDFAEQRILRGDDWLEGVRHMLDACCAVRPLLVCGASFLRSPQAHALQDALQPVVFNGFSANPRYEEAEAGAQVFCQQHCDAILAAGGGSAIDTAKLILHLASGAMAGSDAHYCGAPLVAIPTTAGTGSESTHFAVCYRNGKKESIAHDRLLPDLVVLDPRLLATLPPYHKKSAFMDALCQCVEAIWAAGASPQSTAYAKQGISLLLRAFPDYFSDSPAAQQRAWADVLNGANLSGKAINLAKTTAAHAMSYRLTSLYGIPHGHAVCVSMLQVWAWALAQQPELEAPLACIGDAFGTTSQDAFARFAAMAATLGLDTAPVRREDVPALAASVNPERLGNFPLPLSAADLQAMYERMVQP